MFSFLFLIWWAVMLTLIGFSVPHPYLAFFMLVIAIIVIFTDD